VVRVTFYSKKDDGNNCSGAYAGVNCITEPVIESLETCQPAVLSWLFNKKEAALQLYRATSFCAEKRSTGGILNAFHHGHYLQHLWLFHPLF
jgi:hypothetical protein